MNKISVVINTLNEEANIEKAILSVRWADEIIVCDMYSDDKTVLIAKKLGAKIFFHKRAGFVEPARNFAISKAIGDWVLVLDADEEIPQDLKTELMRVSEEGSIDYLKIPRKNIIFNKWIKNSRWWPDYKIRFFKRGTVKWSDQIHRPPDVTGIGYELPSSEKIAIVHYHYTSIRQFIERMNRYTDEQAMEIVRSGYRFRWQDLFQKPLSEFLSRYFFGKGYEDGLHGLVLSLLQAISFLVVYMKVWDQDGFEQDRIQLDQVKREVKSGGGEIRYWLMYTALSNNPIKATLQKIKYKLGR